MLASEAETECWSFAAVLSAISTTRVIALLMISTVADIFFPVSLERLDKLRTASATTAKPRPDSPARAASIAALSASRLVCAAIAATSLAMLSSSPV
ncbi:hypothetical protein D3C81_2041010 [compost metagenome]